MICQIHSLQLPSSRALTRFLCLLLLCAHFFAAEANRKKNKLPDNPPRGTVDIEHLEREQENARQKNEAIAFIVGKNPNSVKEKGRAQNNRNRRNRAEKKDPEIEAIEGIISDLRRGARLIYLEKGAKGDLGNFVSSKLKQAGKQSAYGVVFDAELKAYYGTVTAADWKKAEKNRDRAGDEIFERFKEESPLERAP